MATLCWSGSSFVNAIVNGSPAGTSMQPVSNSMPLAVMSTTPSTACVQSPSGSDCTGAGSTDGSGLGSASASPSISPCAPRKTSSCWVSYQARYAVTPSGVTATDGIAPVAVSAPVSIGSNASPWLEAKRTPFVPSTQATHVVPSSSTATDVPAPSSSAEPSATSDTGATSNDPPGAPVATTTASPS